MPAARAADRLRRVQTPRPTWSSRLGVTLAAVLVVPVLVLLLAGAERPTTLLLPVGVAAAAVATSVWALLRSRAQRRRYEDRLAAWAGEQAVQAERLRIARDLHDLASHGLGLITVRAAAAASVAGPRGEAERAAALADIERVSRATTTELRRMLTVLRTPGSDPAPLQPAETLADLPAIVRATRDSGLDARLDPPGTAGLDGVSPGVQLAVCAVVREGLGNAARHAGPTRARAEVRRVPGAVVATVRDDGPADGWEPRPGAGHGLLGLRERVTALGGTLHAAPDGRGFTLTARIPDEAAP
jgi:signal transduction histidine kinase